MPRTYSVARSLRMAARPQRVYALVADFRRWPTWSPWEGIDPHLTRVYSGARTGLGASFSWRGNRRAGRGRMKIVDAVEPSVVRVACDFEKPLPTASTTVYTFDPVPGGTQVTWSVAGTKTRSLLALGLVVSMDTLLGPRFENGLARMKAVVEESTPGLDASTMPR